jgi:alkanesulfonate monooxygenase SsuD/methylene tetrahydromethanopterin reductase-like flavin-dependent oxidoreductase (luciferase family)
MKVGCVILLRDLQELGRAPRYSEVREMALLAENAQLDSIWLYDHLLYRDEGQPQIGIWECWTMLSALAEATQRVELGSLVICNQFRNPALLAKMAVTLDEVSNGRFILGLGAGWNQAEFDAFGIPFDHRLDRLEEALQIIRPLLKEGQADFAGTYYRANNCEISPRGPRAVGPPLMLGGSGPRLLRLTAQYADLWNTGYLAYADSLPPQLTALQTACREVGRNPATLPITVLITLAFPDLRPPEAWMESYISGSIDEIAAAFLAYQQLDVTHLMVHIGPYTATALIRLAQAMQRYRGLAGEQHE